MVKRSIKRGTAKALISVARALDAKRITLCRPAFDRLTATEYQGTAVERDIQSGICELLDQLRIPYSVTDAAIPVSVGRCPECRAWVKLYGKKGHVRKSWPDITGVLPVTGRMLAIEVKTEKGRYKPGQPEMLELLRKAGALVIVARSIDDVSLVLARAGYRT